MSSRSHGQAAPEPDYYRQWLERLRSDNSTDFAIDKQTGWFSFVQFKGGDPFNEPVIVAIAPSDLNRYVSNLIGEDGTVYGNRQRDEPAERDPHAEAFSLFNIHLDEFFFTDDGPQPGPWRLDPVDFIVAM